jgi:thiol-disulfide isomerase/thioredoxin
VWSRHDLSGTKCTGTPYETVNSEGGDPWPAGAAHIVEDVAERTSVKRARTAIGVSAVSIAMLLTVSACGTTSEQASPDTEVGSEPTGEPMTGEPVSDQPVVDEPVTGEPVDAASVTDEPMDAASAVDLDFTATTLDGATFEGASLAGKPALLWFWAPWCPTCAGQADHVSEVAAEYAGQVNVVGVGGLDQAAAMRTFVEDRGVGGFVHLSDESGEVWQRFGITSQSTYVVLDAAGVVVAEGVLSEGELDDALSSSLS